MEPKNLNRIVIGDLHGQAKMLSALLDFHGTQNHFIFLGDYVDRGPEVKSVIDLIMSLPYKTVLLGNHEQIFMRILKGPLLAENYSEANYRTEKKAWMTPIYGGLETLKSFDLDSDAEWDDLPEVYQDFLEGLLHFYEENDAVFVHAGLEPNLELAKQSLQVLLWVRDPWMFKLRSYRGKKVFFGHTIAKYFPGQCNSQGVIHHNDCIGLDTGAYDTGLLTSAVLEVEKKPHIYQYQHDLGKVIDLGELV